MDREDVIERAKQLMESESYSHGGLIGAHLVKLSEFSKDTLPAGLVNDFWLVSFKLVEEPNSVECVDSADCFCVKVDDVTGEAKMSSML